MSIKYITETEARTHILKSTRQFRIRTFSEMIHRTSIDGNTLFINTEIGGVNVALDEEVKLPLTRRTRWLESQNKAIPYYNVSRVGATFHWEPGGTELLVTLTGRYDYFEFGNNPTDKYILIKIEKPGVYLTRLSLWLGRENRQHPRG